MLICKYTDPPLTQKEQQELQQKKNSNEAYTEPLSDFDITNFVTKWTWSGDSEQAARKLEFEIVYNTVDKDSAFTALDLKVGGFIYLSYAETEESEPVEIFQGRIFTGKEIPIPSHFLLHVMMIWFIWQNRKCKCYLMV